MNQELLDIAKRVNWYTPPEELLGNQDLFLCQVMARAHAEDVARIQKLFPISVLKNAYLKAPAGLFDPRSWAYWGLVLFNDRSLPMPKRFPEADHFNWRKFGA